MGHFKREDCLNDFVLPVLGEIVVKGEPQEAVTDPLRHWALPRAPAKPETHRRQMQRKIVKNSENPAASQVLDQSLPLRERMHDHIEHVVRLYAMRRNVR